MIFYGQNSAYNEHEIKLLPVSSSKFFKSLEPAEKFNNPFNSPKTPNNGYSCHGSSHTIRETKMASPSDKHQNP